MFSARAIFTALVCSSLSLAPAFARAAKTPVVEQAHLTATDPETGEAMPVCRLNPSDLPIDRKFLLTERAPLAGESDRPQDLFLPPCDASELSVVRDLASRARPRAQTAALTAPMTAAVYCGIVFMAGLAFGVLTEEGFEPMLRPKVSGPVMVGLDSLLLTFSTIADGYIGLACTGAGEAAGYGLYLGLLNK